MYHDALYHIVAYYIVYRASVSWPELQSWMGLHFDAGYSIECATKFICNLFGIPAIARLLCEGHRGIFIVYQTMLVAWTPSLTSIQGTAHTLMHCLECETPGCRQFIAGLRFKPRRDNSEVSVNNSRPSCLPLQLCLFV